MSNQYVLQSFATDDNGKSLALNIQGSGAQTDRTLLDAYPLSGTNHQLWTLQESGTPGYFYFVSPLSVEVSGSAVPLVVNIQGTGTPATGTGLDVYHQTTGDDHQLWTIGIGEQQSGQTYYFTLRSPYQSGAGQPLVMNIKGSGNPADRTLLDVYPETPGDAHQLWRLVTPTVQPEQYTWSPSITLLPVDANLGTQGSPTAPNPNFSAPVMVGAGFYPGAPVFVITQWADPTVDVLTQNGPPIPFNGDAPTPAPTVIADLSGAFTIALTDINDYDLDVAGSDGATLSVQAYQLGGVAPYGEIVTQVQHTWSWNGSAFTLMS
jgi:hypothetical protein